jgi:DnaJ domain
VSRAPTPDDFAVLGLRPGAGAAEIRDAYRRLAKVHHPDRNPGDPTALATFRRLTDSYAALRDRRSGGAGPSPLSAAQVTRRRARARRARAAVATLADLPVGGALWVAADAVLASPDRVAALRPSAEGSAFPTADEVIRVERRADGHHVFMPPQPSARWAVGPAAETDGLSVAALWVGDRQEGEPGSAPAARLPLRLITGTVGEMAVDDRGWVAHDALAVDAEGAWSLDLAQPVSHEPHRATPLRVLRDADGFRVHSDLPAAEWPAETLADTPRGPVLTAMLAGVPHPTRSADGG